jgi:hypothetical protein
MGRKVLVIAGIVLIALVAAVATLQRTKRRSPLVEEGAGAAQTAGDRRPFRSVVVELTFRSKSVHQGEEYLIETGRGIEYIDAIGGRRRQDYEHTVTTLRQLTSTEGLTMIFDGTKLYMVSNKGGNRAGRVSDLRQGYDYTVWQDASIERLELPGMTVTEEQFLTRQCKVYTLAKGVDIQKWWVWNGVTLRSESHLETTSTVWDTSEEAVRVDEVSEINSDLFTPPLDVTFEPANQTVADQQDHHKPAPWVRMRPDLMFGIYF